MSKGLAGFRGGFIGGLLAAHMAIAHKAIYGGQGSVVPLPPHLRDISRRTRKKLTTKAQRRIEQHANRGKKLSVLDRIRNRYRREPTRVAQDMINIMSRQQRKEWRIAKGAKSRGRDPEITSLFMTTPYQKRFMEGRA